MRQKITSGLKNLFKKTEAEPTHKETDQEDFKDEKRDPADLYMTREQLGTKTPSKAQKYPVDLSSKNNTSTSSNHIARDPADLYMMHEQLGIKPEIPHKKV